MMKNENVRKLSDAKVAFLFTSVCYLQISY